MGRSGSSRNAPVGQADTQDRHSVHPLASISTAPNGAPFGSATTPTRSGAARCSSLSAKRSTLLLAPSGRKLVGRGAGGIAGIARNASNRTFGSSVSMVAIRPAPKPSPDQDRIGQRQRPQQSGNVMRRPRPKQKPHRRCAIGEGGGDALQPDLRDLVDRKRQHMRRQPVAEPRQRIDQRRAMRIVMHQHNRLFAAGLAIGDQHRAEPAHQRIFRVAARRMPHR